VVDLSAVRMSVVRLWADGVVLVVFVVAAVVSLQGVRSPTYWFPAFITVSGTLAAGYNLVADLLRVRAGRSLTEGEIVDIGASVSDSHDDAGERDGDPAAGSVAKRVLALTLWLVALPLLGLVIPFFYASLIWLVAILRFQAKLRWRVVLASVAVFAVVLNVLIVLLAIKMPPAVLTGLG
jgi:hypothetical protein